MGREKGGREKGAVWDAVVYLQNDSNKVPTAEQAVTYSAHLQKFTLKISNLLDLQKSHPKNYPTHWTATEIYFHRRSFRPFLAHRNLRTKRTR
jgi:hypothetical protein